MAEEDKTPFFGQDALQQLFRYGLALVGASVTALGATGTIDPYWGIGIGVALVLVPLGWWAYWNANR